MTFGIYCYSDKKDNSIVYVGKDSHIDTNNRKYDHQSPSKYEHQPFNRILQNNPNRYTYQVLVYDVADEQTLNALEIQYIRQLKPRFNFTEGGDGYGCGKNNPNYGGLSETHKQKISEARTKPYARVIRAGYTPYGTQRYGLNYKGKQLQKSTNKAKLERLAFEINNKENI